MNTLVMKFGGAAVATPQQFSKIADIILKKNLIYSRIAVVVSAMGKTTDQLIDLAKQVNETPPRRELDMLLSVGERISISLLAMALALKNKEAISFTGSQSGIITCSRHTDARIIDVKPFRLLPHLNAGIIVIVAGFQGVSREGNITTLGRGGSDTTAAALAVALKADLLEYYKNVPGIGEEDPTINPKTKIFSHLDYEEALEIAQKGAKVLHPRCIMLAQKNHRLIHVLSFEETQGIQARGTSIGSKPSLANLDPIYENEDDIIDARS